MKNFLKSFLDPETRYPAFWPWVTWAGVSIALMTVVGLLLEDWEAFSSMVFIENGPIETLESVLLTTAAVIFAIRAFGKPGTIADICIPLVFLLVFASVREIPRCDSTAYFGGICLERSIKGGINVAAAAIAAALLLARRADLIDMLRPRRTLVFWPLWVSLSMLGLAEIGETVEHRGIEEGLEFVAYLYTGAVGVWVIRHG